MKTYTIPKGTLAYRFPSIDGWEAFNTTKTVVYTEKDIANPTKYNHIIFALPEAAAPYTLLLVHKKNIQ